MSNPASRLRFWATAYAMLVLLIGTNLATPLYQGYAERFRFSPVVLTLVFASYIAVLIPSLLVAGPLSDAVGRRRVLLPAVVLAAAGSLVLALAPSTEWLFAGRVLQGLAVGAASAPLTAALTELEPHGDRRKAALVSTVASASGLGGGPLLGGLLAQYAPAPHVLPYVVEIALLVPAVAVVATLPPTAPAARWRPSRPGIPPGMRAVFATSGTANFLAFTVIGLFLTLVPGYVADLSGSRNLLLAGAAVALLPVCSAIAQLAGYGRQARALEFLGLPLLAAGLVLLAVAGGTSSAPLLLIAAVIAGTGHGLVFLGGLTTINESAPTGRRAEALAAFYVVMYLGSGVPVIGVGALATLTGVLPAVQEFAVAVALAASVLTLALARRGRRVTARHP
ncbi:MFS transporter [Pseudonocardia zijingensis]|jgi:MFS family permease|uniref:MFS transporter n=1 Tax=Pseudonocardia zijingensis TaxID=153376 RepID=A0ABN1N7G7_9PSEU